MVAPVVAAGAARVVHTTASRQSAKLSQKGRGRKITIGNTQESRDQLYSSVQVDTSLTRPKPKRSSIGTQRIDKRNTADRVQRIVTKGRRQLGHARAIQKRKKDIPLISSSTARRARVLSILLFFVPLYIVPYGVQVAFALLYVKTSTTWYLKAIDNFSGWVANSLFESTLDLTISEIAQVVIFLIGGLSLLVAAFWCAAYRVRLSSPFVFPFGAAIALAGSYAPYLFFLPWPLLWLLVVLWTQK